jgi:hypothetical protein
MKYRVIQNGTAGGRWFTVGETVELDEAAAIECRDYLDGVKLPVEKKAPVIEPVVETAAVEDAPADKQIKRGRPKKN